MGLALLALLVWLLLVILPLVLGIYLVWKQTGTVRLLGYLILLIVVYRQVHWTSPWYVTKGSELVQEYKLNHPTSGSVRWMESSNHLILVPDERVTTIPETLENNHVLVVDLEARDSRWQPKSKIDLEQTISIGHPSTDISNLETKTEFSFVGFSLPFLVYQFSWPFGETRAWQWEKSYLGWERFLVQEIKSGSVVELNRLMLNTSRFYGGGVSGWVMEGKFLIYAPDIYTVASDLFTDRRIFALGPFGTSQSTQSQLIDKNK